MRSTPRPAGPARAAPALNPPGSQLPSGRVLADEYDVSQSTISRAVARLRQQGVLVGRPGRGVFVTESNRH
ncbi:winged helix-turn-helix transcriptional regulator [Micromonospora sp. Llam7]|uniref:GntR family transcriptional regulator n=1 Tax=Micromonospora tarapacensis TaxID=2835305 RepID=UPI001C83B9AE|nr:winged helix-turn-helix domain-containing protein [Micromonospora tarapacensis]MBX7269418.1 winged helix-turn-helix transcriptional regulator [Micromonospora tarapacensis]